MKTLRLNRLLLLGFLVTGSIATTAQSTLESEVPGDHFSLEGALELFKKSASPEEFEKKLNSPDSRVNNLDLNNDNYTDYIRVIDRTDRNVHAFILQAVLSENESQDVAVIELEKLHNGKAVLQITGDADVYGIETIIEPTEEVRSYAGTTTNRTVVNVWSWPSVQYVYSPYYSVWVSPWYWAYQPIWWRPWRPVAYYVYDPWWSPYRSYYSSYHTHRVHYAREIYRPYRTTSVIVVNNYGNQINHYRSRNDYRHHDRDHYSNAYNYNNSGSRNNSRSHDRDRNNNNRNNVYRGNGNNNGNQNTGNNNSGRSNDDLTRDFNKYRSTDRNVPTNQDANFKSMKEKLNASSSPAYNRTPEQTKSFTNAGTMRKPIRSNDDQIQPQRKSTSSFSKPEQRQSNSSFSRPQQQRTSMPSQSFSKPQQQRTSTPSQSFSRPQQQRSSTPSQSFSRPQPQRSSGSSQSFSRPQQQRSSGSSQSFKSSSERSSVGKRGR